MTNNEQLIERLRQMSPMTIGPDAADALEALQARVGELEEAPELLRGSIRAIEKERDTLRAEIEGLKAQEPFAYAYCYQGQEPALSFEPQDKQIPKTYYWQKPLYAGPIPVPEGLTVKLAEMRESNGRVTWTVFLAKSEDMPMWDCHQFYSDSIKGRAEYEADNLKHFLGLGPMPDILSYDTDAPQAPSAPQASDVKELVEALEIVRDAFNLKHVDEQPKTFGCHHAAKTCAACEGMVRRWEASNRVVAALAKHGTQAAKE